MGIDIVCGIALALMCWRAYRQGFARQVIQLCGLALGVMFAEPVGAKAAPLLQKYAPSMPDALRGPALALGALFVIWLGASTIGSILLVSYRKRVYGDTTPSLGDSVFGLAVGGLKAAFVVSLAVYAFDRLPDSVRTAKPVAEQVEASRGVKLAHDYKLIDRLVGTKEVRAVAQRMGELVEYFKASDAGKPDPGKPAAGVDPLSLGVKALEEAIR